MHWKIPAAALLCPRSVILVMVVSADWKLSRQPTMRTIIEHFLVKLILYLAEYAFSV